MAATPLLDGASFFPPQVQRPVYEPWFTISARADPKGLLQLWMSGNMSPGQGKGARGVAVPSLNTIRSTAELTSSRGRVLGARWAAAPSAAKCTPCSPTWPNKNKPRAPHHLECQVTV